MRTNKEILDKYGELIVKDILDGYYASTIELINLRSAKVISSEYSRMFDKLTDSEKKLMISYINVRANSLLFSFLKIFEEHPEFKLLYESDSQNVNLVTISEMLKAEAIIEGGWIDRFSKEREKNSDYVPLT